VPGAVEGGGLKQSAIDSVYLIDKPAVLTFYVGSGLLLSTILA